MIIFDLDGCLADCEHRRHFVRPHEKKWIDEEQYYGPEFKGQSGYALLNKDGSLFKPNWTAFYEACGEDLPIVPVIAAFLAFYSNDIEIEIWSGRCESVRRKTVRWLETHVPIYNDEYKLKMRPIGDNTPDDQLKERWLDEAIAQGKKIDFVFDDRPKVVRMWRSHGIFVFNCCQHDEEF